MKNAIFTNNVKTRLTIKKPFERKSFEYDNKAILNNNKRGKNVVTK
jgi:hypothetical protein